MTALQGAALAVQIAIAAFVIFVRIIEAERTVLAELKRLRELVGKESK